MAMEAPEHREPMMDDAPVAEPGAMTAPKAPVPPRRGHRRWLLGLGTLVAVLAFVAFATTSAFAQAGGKPGGAGFGGGGGRDGFGGFQAVVASVDSGANTITLAGVPQQIGTVQVNANVQLVAQNPDGTTRPAAIGDFRAGSLVRVGFGRGAAGAAGAATTTPGAGNRGIAGAFAVNRLTLVPDNIASVSGIVLANNNGVYTVATQGNQRVTVRTQGGTTYTKNRNEAATAADVRVGSRIFASGTQAADGVTASTVRVVDLSTLPQGGQGGMRPGRGPGMMPGAMPGAMGTPAASPTR